VRHRKLQPQFQLRLPAVHPADSSQHALPCVRSRGRDYPENDHRVATLFDAEGTMGTLLRAFDWPASPLGPVSQWPSSLRTAVRLCLDSQCPFILFWGADLIMLYHDPLPIVQANADSFALVFHQILDNALKFHRPETPQTYTSGPSGILMSGSLRSAIRASALCRTMLS
jgi:hypothetical protein